MGIEIEAKLEKEMMMVDVSKGQDAPQVGEKGKERAPAIDASQFQAGAAKSGDGVKDGASPHAEFDNIISKLGAKPAFADLEKAYPKLIAAVERQDSKAESMSIPMGSVPHQWMLNDLWNPAFKLGENIEKDPGKLKPEDGRLVEALLNKHAEGRTVDPATGENINKKLDEYARLDPRVKETRDKIDATLNGEYKDVYQDYQSKYIPFVDAQSAEKAKVSNMLTVVRERILDATGVPANRRQDLVSMLQRTSDEERQLLRF